MKKKLLLIGVCALLLGIMCTSVFAGMSNEVQTIEVTGTGFKCSCGGNMTVERTYGDWVALSRTSCQYGRGFCTDEVRSRSVSEVWKCESCEKTFTNTYDETKQVCLGRL